jgi:hypothetical protein
MVTLLKLSFTSKHLLDPRTKHYLLVGDGRAIAYLILFYYLFIVVGRRVMKNRAPVEVPISILFGYNFALVLLSLYMFEEVFLNSCFELGISLNELEL